MIGRASAVAILAQDTSLAAAAKQAFCFKGSHFEFLLEQVFLDQPALVLFFAVDTNEPPVGFKPTTSRLLSGCSTN